MMLLMTRSFVVLLLALLSIGCEYAYPQLTFRVSDEFSQEEYDVIQAEADHLCHKTDGAYCAVMTRYNSPNSIVRGQLPDGELGLARVEQDYDNSTIKITIDRSVTEKLGRVVRHELGHAGGCLRHLPKGNVMSETEKQQPEDWTAADVECVSAGY